MVIRAGDMRHKIELRQPTKTPDGAGEVIVTYPTATATVMAAVVELVGEERFSAQQLHAEVSARFDIHYLPNVGREWRIVHAGRNYDIVDKIEVDQGRMLQLLAKTVGE